MKQLYILLLLSILSSCNKPQYLSEEQLKAYVIDPDHGLSEKNEVNEVVTTVTYRPTDLLVAQELRSASPTVKEIERIRGKYNKYAYFVLNISNRDRDVLTGLSDYDRFSRQLNTFAFGMAEFVNLTTPQKDTIPVADYIFPRTYGAGKSTAMLFAFNNEQFKNREWIQLNLKEMGLGTGDQSFRFRVADLQEVPEIDFMSN